MIPSEKWVLASEVLGSHERIAEFALLAQPTLCILVNEEEVVNPTLGQMGQARRFNDMPWGNIFILRQFANAITKWRSDHGEKVPNPL